MADWSRLVEHLETRGTEVTLTWAALEDVVGRLPPSASKHRAWWSGDRPYVRLWKSAGFRLSAVDPGRGVTFTRDAAGIVWNRPTESEVPSDTRRYPSTATILLITCVKTKLGRAAAAKDLYISPLFKDERKYAEASGVQWFILSAEHGLVQPDEWLVPYERYLPDTPRSYRRAWGVWVVERLALLAGPLQGHTIEVHASAAYVDAISEAVEAHGATLLDPLRGLDRAKRRTWYAGQHRPDDRPSSDPGSFFVSVLSDRTRTISPDELLAADRTALSRPGLYSWWADEQAAADLTTGLGHEVKPGLIYAGLAGATRWPSGKRSTNTLWGRLVGMHLGKRHEFSTFRRTVGSVLAAKDGSADIDEIALTTWMNSHLRVVAEPYDDADTLGRLESEVLATLNPPLNLQGMRPSPIRKRLTELRRAHAAKREATS